MDIGEITSNIGDYTFDSILITKAEPIDGPDGPEIVWCNRSFSEMTGYSLGEILGKTPRFLQGPDTDREALNRIVASLRAWKPVLEVVKNYTKAGEPFFSEISIVPVADAKGWFHYWVSIQRDVTERVERERHLAERNRALAASERALQEEKAQLSGIAAVAHHARDMITITDTEFRILWANPAFHARTGYSDAAVRGAIHHDLLSRKSEHLSLEDTIRRVNSGEEFRDTEVRNYDRDGQVYWTDVQISTQRDASGRPERFVIVERDVTHQRKQRMSLESSRREIAAVSVHDSLTGLRNRRGFEEAFCALAQRAARNGHGVGLLHIDLDHFKQINDTLGHAAGDAVLVQVTERIQAQLGPEAFAARMGGDEFVIAVELHHPDQDLALFSNRILQDVRRPVRYENSDCRFGASIGFTERRRGAFDAKDMLIEADIALYRAKNLGRNRTQGFGEALKRDTQARKKLSDELSIALENGDFFPVYQPQFCARTERIVGVEALVRWNHPERGLVGPAEFLSLARELNYEVLIDRRMFEQVHQDMFAMQAAGCLPPHLSVNISALRLRSPELLDEIRGYRRPAECHLSFELLESTFLDDAEERVQWTLDALRQLGVRIEIDDFGTGHASITGLLRVRPDVVKIDRELLMPATESEEHRKLFEHIVGIGKTLDIVVTCEGVETEEHKRLAQRAGCDVLQGYHFARPMRLEAFLSTFGTGEAVA
jgi:diguanylate cyclase (GGDEF)-like protein/PAS domain S-box-containing protein